MSDGVRQDLYAKIIEVFHETKSLRETAQQCGTSLVTAQRVLITEGLWESKRSQEIGGLWAAGKTLPEIAAILRVSENAVRAYLPYSRGKYGVSETTDASQSRAYRTRKQKAEENMRQLHQQAPDPSGRILLFPGAMKQTEPTPQTASPSEQVYHLRLELVTDYDTVDHADFLRLAKAQHGISREILVPGDVNLHALHYAIQRLFGWQNSHLHHFSLPDPAFNGVTSGKLGRYFDLCGILFRFPDADPGDRYWDDDYNGNQSIKTWFSKKYTRPFRNLSMTDTLIGAIHEVTQFWDVSPQYKDSSNLNAMRRDFVFEDDLNALNEGVKLAELLKAPDATAMPLQLWQRETLQKRQSMLDLWEKAPQDVLLDAMSQLMTWRSSRQDWEQMMWLDPKEAQKQARKKMHTSAEAVLYDHQKAIEYWEKMTLPLVQIYRVAMTPQFDTLLYHYDYGDDWMVTLTVEAVYDMQQNEMSEAAKTVQKTGKPICIAADGLSVMDDCGGVHSYLEFLRTLEHGDPEEAAEAREWAREMGWNSRKKKPENML